MRLHKPLLLSVIWLSLETPARQEVVDVLGADGVPADAIAAVRRSSDRALVRLGPSFPLKPTRFTVVVHSSDDSLPPAVRRSFHEGTAGVALLGSQRVHLILDRMGIRPPNDLDTVVLHEVAHILLHQYAGPNVPRWFHEGLAQALAGATYLGASEEGIAFYAQTGNLLPFSKLRTTFPRRPGAIKNAYAQSFSFVSFLMRRVGLPELLAAAAQCGADRNYYVAFQRQVGRPLVTLEEEWVEYVKTGSGAAWRALFASCFALSMVGVLPLLVLAGSRRWNRDHRSRRRLEGSEGADSGEGEAPPGATP